MALLVCTATAEELAALAPKLFPSPDGLEEMRIMSRPVGNGHDGVLFCITGVGPVNAALAMGFCFGQTADRNAEGLQIDAIVNVGLAGAHDLESHPLRSFCVVTEEIWPEYGLHDGISVTARAFSHPLWKVSDNVMVHDRISLASPEDLELKGTAWQNWARCPSLSVAGVTASFARAEALWNGYHADLENMEGFAVAYACARAHVPCLEIRCVSNKTGPRRKDEKDFPGALAAMEDILPALGIL